MERLDGKAAPITGADRGMGRAFAERFVAKGHGEARSGNHTS